MQVIDPKIIDVLSLPSLTYADRRRLPRIPVVYFVFRAGTDEIVYIGQSKCLNDRWLQHDKSWQFQDTDHIAWYVVEGKEQRCAFEKSLIQHWKPRYNRKDVRVLGDDFRTTSVRVRPELLRDARYFLDEEGKSLQEFLADQLEQYVQRRKQEKSSSPGQQCA